MYDNQSKGISYSAGFFMLIAFVIAGLFLVAFINAPVWEYMTGLKFSEYEKNLGNPAYADAMKVIQTITAIAGFFLPALVVAALLSRQPVKLLGFSGNIRPSQIGLVFLIIGASMIVSSSLSYLNYHIPLPGSWKIRFDKLEEEYNRRAAAIIVLKNFKDYILAMIIMGFLPALCEETLFRGGLQNFLTRSTGRPWLSILIVSILFSLAHISFYGLLYRLFLGVVLGAFFHYSGKLWLCILAHFLNNAVAVTALYIYTQQGKPLQEALKTDGSGLWGMLALPVVIGLFILFRRVSVKRRLI
jgi:membrane protease YdiL (CAAX protease family)